MTFAGLVITASGVFLMTIVGFPVVSRRIRGLEATGPTYKYWVFSVIALGFLGTM